VVEKVAAAVRDRRPGEWVLGRGWHESKWTEAPADAVRGFPRHDALSQVAPDNPVALDRADGHAVLVNAKAMEQMGITNDTVAPAGGEIIRDQEGNATGVFVDNAQSLIRPPERTADENRRALALAMEEALENGVTTLTDAGASPEAVALFREYAAAGKLGVRLYVMASGLAALKEWKEPRVGIGDGFLTLRAVKLYADGAMGSRGAAMLDPYDDDPSNSGLLVMPPEDILEAARWALPRGFQVATHAIGDRANRIVLDQY
jgi:predicted amidohydrolase YtcJ